MLNKLTSLLKDAGIFTSDHQKNQLIAYVNMLHKWNKAYNLTSVRDLMRCWYAIFSIALWWLSEWYGLSISGTGPELPGIPLSIIAS